MATDFASVAQLLASAARSTVVDALMEGRPLPAGELAQLAGVRPSTISEHLAALVGGGLVAVDAVGRHRYYRLASPSVAEALESLARICPPTRVKSLRQSRDARRLRLARTCYDHLAGRLGVALLDAMLAGGWLVPDYGAEGPGFTVSRAGTERLAGLDVDVEGCRRRRRRFARPCLDWTERRPHLAGAIGAAVAASLSDRGWVRRTGAGRGLRITPAGHAGLTSSFGLDADALDADVLETAAPDADALAERRPTLSPPPSTAASA
ncbi:MAG TPA: helix-turn-helix transcriptional regulator [Actinopolymorphaceae bacterium]|nr:helix-turn-helix transcriptional regulator [Actinopolymorphaceae bacterium]